MSVPFVEVTLDKPRKLRFPISAMKKVEEILGVSVTNMLNLVDISLDQLMTLLTVGLKWDDPDITQEQVDKIVDDNWPDVTSLYTTVTSALTLGIANKIYTPDEIETLKNALTLQKAAD